MTFLQALQATYQKISKKAYEGWQALSEKICQLIALISISSQGFVMTATAEPQAANVNSGLGKILNLFCFVFMWVGIILLVAGIIQIISAIRNEDGERAQKNVAGALVGLLMAANKPIVQAILTALGVGVTIPAGSPF